MSLSVIIITKNEEADIRSCLESVSWADEIVVVDSASTDDTAAICREYGAKVQVVRDWPGFGPQKNRALAQATCDWVLSLDADERVTPALRLEIEAVMRERGEADAYDIPRSSSYCGRFMRHSGWYPDYVTRLFKRGSARFSDDLVHERLLVKGNTGRLQGELLHYAFDGMEEVLRKVDQYSTAGALRMHAQGRKATLAGAVLRGLWSFVRTYFLKRGFLDGREGFMLAVSNAEGTYYRNVKLILLNRKQ
ncbi:MAG TPA: glycosyltransferase family 2 protein [Gallionellaceae bacterium]